MEKSERLGRERSIDSRASSVSRREDRVSAAPAPSHKKSRDEYDEELRRFQSDRGKFEDSDRCFTPPHNRRAAAAAVGHLQQPPPPLSRSPSPPLSRRGRSPGGHSRSSVSGYELRADGGGSGHRNFSDRDSVVSDGSRQGSPSRDSYRGSGGPGSSSSSRYKPRTQVISPPPGGGGIDSRLGSPADMDDYESRRRRFRNLGDNGESSDFRTARLSSGDRARDRAPVDPRMVTDHHEESNKKGPYKLAGVDSGLSEDTSSGSTGSVPDVDNAKLSARVSVPPRRISTDSAVSRSSHPGGLDSLPPSPLTAAGLYTSSSSSAASSSSALLRVVSACPDVETMLSAASVTGFGAPRTPSSPPDEEAESEGSRPGTPLCDENPENLMSRPAAGPVRLASHLRTSSTSEPMSLPLPM